LSRETEGETRHPRAKYALAPTSKQEILCPKHAMSNKSAKLQPEAVAG
jgi:hypothetical protein